MDDKELLQQALDALISVWNMDKTTKQVETIQAIKARLTQPEKEWVGLTDEEIGTLTVFDGLHYVEVPLLANFARAIEAKLKDKNHG